MIRVVIAAVVGFSILGIFGPYSMPIAGGLAYLIVRKNFEAPAVDSPESK